MNKSSKTNGDSRDDRQDHWEEPLFGSKADAVKIITGSILGVAAAIYCFRAASSQADGTINVLLCIFSGLVGWVLGIVITPSSTREKSRFSEYGKALTAAAGGFFAGQLKDIFPSSKPTLEINHQLSARHRGCWWAVASYSDYCSPLFSEATCVGVKVSCVNEGPKQQRLLGKRSKSLRP
jgi:hypothetical protein